MYVHLGGYRSSYIMSKDSNRRRKGEGLAEWWVCVQRFTLFVLESQISFIALTFSFALLEHLHCIRV